MLQGRCRVSSQWPGSPVPAAVAAARLLLLLTSSCLSLAASSHCEPVCYYIKPLSRFYEAAVQAHWATEGGFERTAMNGAAKDVYDDGR
jgi:hypothetical protein